MIGGELEKRVILTGHGISVLMLDSHGSYTDLNCHKGLYEQGHRLGRAP